jgi:WD40 repeat protein
VVTRSHWTVQDLSTARVLSRRRLASEEMGFPMLSADGRLALFANRAGELWTWRGSTGRVERGVVHRASVRCAAAADHESFAVSGDAIGQLRFASIARPDVCAGWIDAHEGAVAAVHIVSQERVLSAGEDGMLCAWDVTTGRALMRFRQSEPIASFTVTPDGDHVLFTRERGDIVCLDARTLEWRWTRKMHPTMVVHMASLGADGRMASLDAEGRLIVWQADHGTEIARWWIEGPPRGLAALSDRFVACVDARGVVRVFEVVNALAHSRHAASFDLVAQARQWIEDCTAHL